MTTRDQCLHILQSSPTGLTTEEVARETGKTLGATKAAILRMYHAGMVEESGDERPVRWRVKI